MDSQQQSPPKLSPAEAIASWLRTLILPGQVFEIRALGCSTPSYARRHNRGGFFHYDAIADAAAAALSLTNCGAQGVYFTINPLTPALLSRRCNRVDVIGRENRLADDSDVVRRSLLFLDFDPVRPAGISSTDAEKQAAHAVAMAAHAWLATRGWPAPVIADSGNGWHLLYRIDEPADDQNLIRSCLHAVAAKFGSPAVDVDKSVFNPARICKLYGTLSRKGDSTPDRPHRRAIVTSIPSGGLQAVPTNLLRELAAEAPADSRRSSQSNRSKPQPSSVGERARKYLSHLNPSIEGQHGHNDAYRAACELVRGFSLSIEDAFPLLEEWNQRCSPPWSERELRHKLEQAAEKAEGEPGYLLRGETSPFDFRREQQAAAYASVVFTGFDEAPPATAGEPQPRTPDAPARSPPSPHVVRSLIDRGDFHWQRWITE